MTVVITRATIPLSIRTVVVTTMSAVRTHGQAGNEQLARDSVIRGLALLDAMKADDPADGTDRLYADARRELRALVEDGGGAHVPR